MVHKYTAKPRHPPKCVASKLLNLRYVAITGVFGANSGFVGPWCTDGACAPANTSFVNLSYHEGDFIKLPYGQGGEFEGMAPFKPYHESL